MDVSPDGVLYWFRLPLNAERSFIGSESKQLFPNPVPTATRFNIKSLKVYVYTVNGSWILLLLIPPESCFSAFFSPLLHNGDPLVY